jgi:formate hydrogenlyase transcriptional activator
MDALMSYEWPGNIRELQNVIERSVILSRGKALDLAMPETDTGARVPRSMQGSELDAERDKILQVLRETRGLVSGPNGAAQRLGLKRTTLQARMKKLGIARDYQ